MDYVITVGGHLDHHWSAWFDGMRITRLATGDTMLRGRVVDQAALHGLLIKIRDLGLPLITVMPASQAPEDGDDRELSDGIERGHAQAK